MALIVNTGSDDYCPNKLEIYSDQLDSFVYETWSDPEVNRLTSEVNCDKKFDCAEMDFIPLDSVDVDSVPYDDSEMDYCMTYDDQISMHLNEFNGPTYLNETNMTNCDSYDLFNYFFMPSMSSITYYQYPTTPVSNSMLSNDAIPFVPAKFKNCKFISTIFCFLFSFFLFLCASPLF